MSAILVDLGGTHLRFALWREGESVDVLQRSRIRNFTDGIASCEIWESILKAITDFCARVQNMVDDDAPIVMSFPGPIGDGSQALDCPTVSGGSGALPNLQFTLMERTGRRVQLLNDISAAAWHFSRSIKVSRFMVVTVSSGIGSKIFDRGHPRGVLDDIPYAGEIGHLKIDETSDAPACDCGGYGHLGAISSGRGIERYARRLRGDSTVTNEDTIVPAALAGDPQVLAIIRECTRPLARVLLHATIASGLQQVIVIGGFALSLGEVYRAILQQEITRQCDYRVAASQIENLIVLGEDDGCLLGAAAYASKAL
jgi:glucokinase